ncbi:MULTISPECIES: hypothetical protein [Enterobacter]|uniref:hypothetical protein n=1 Tax=Enterobacter TaxID=547 RepID=UPI001CBBB2AD|nr:MULTISPECIES: hypothetical protein [Enterobacter]MCG7803801.1 hypothetical protein [Enterobacter asburiae]UAN30793.1 hypothetical protein KGP22_16395 [Enterobacter sp. JBIWA005]
MITKNFQLNSLANQYAAALYDHITATSGGAYFMVDVGGQSVSVDIIGGVKGVRDLIDSYALEALRDNYPHWESIGIALMTRCAGRGGITDTGIEIWQSMTNDMGATVSGNGGGVNA